MESMTIDLLVVGGGPAGIAAAELGAELGATVALVESREIGGTCLNRGCIPTKLLLAATDAVEGLATQKKFGILTGQIGVDLAALHRRKALLLGGSRGAVEKRLTGLGVKLVRGEARFAAPGRLAVKTGEDEVELAATNTILATGAAPFIPPVFSLDGEIVCDSDAMLEWTSAPTCLVVVGGGAIGLEAAAVWRRFGTKVVVVEAADTLLPGDDPDVGKTFAQILKRDGVDVRVGAAVASLSAENGRARLVFADGGTVEADKALVAVGRRPKLSALGLETVGAAVDARGFAVVDDGLCAAPGLFAVGDVNGKAMLAHAAEDQARFAVRTALGRTSTPYSPGPVPWIVYGSPETLRVGRSAAELRAAGLDAEERTAHLAANAIAFAQGKPQGFVKIATADGTIHGVSAVGAKVSGMALGAALLIGQALKNAQEIIFAHPSLDESLKAALFAPPAP